MNLLEAWYYAIGKGVRPEKVVKRKSDVMKIYMDGSNIIFTFDPSDDIKDWLSNVKFITESEIHICAKRFSEVVEKYISAMPKYVPHFFGYSRGGALARKMTEHIANKFDKLVICRAFEPPAIMCKENAAYYDEDLPTDEIWTRNGRDPVTYLAPNMHHTGKKVTLKQPWYNKYLPILRSKTHLKKSVEKALKRHKGD